MRICLFLLSLIALQGVGSAANLVVDPGFENPVLTPWVTGGHTWSLTSSNPHTGAQGVETGCIGPACVAADTDPLSAWIFQDLATTNGSSYDLTFWLGLRKNPTDPSVNEVKVLWGGAEVFDIQNIVDPAFVQFTVSGLVASGSTTRLEFFGRNDPGVVSLDDISVDASAGAVPEPAAFLLLGAGLAGFARLRRWRIR